MLLKTNSSLENLEKSIEVGFLGRYIHRNKLSSSENFPEKILVHRVSKVIDTTDHKVTWQLHFFGDNATEKIILSDEIDEFYLKIPSVGDLISLAIESIQKIFPGR